MNDEHDQSKQKKSISAEKLAANCANAKRSTGPRTPDGKSRSSQNSYKHGFFAQRLFQTRDQVTRDGEDYNRVYATYQAHYRPVGDVENLLVEQIAAESLRIARLLELEQTVLGWGTPFEMKSVDKIVRYESSVSRQLEKTIDRLELVQEKRRAETQTEDSELLSRAVGNEPVEVTQESSGAPDGVPNQEEMGRGADKKGDFHSPVASD